MIQPPARQIRSLTHRNIWDRMGGRYAQYTDVLWIMPSGAHTMSRYYHHITNADALRQAARIDQTLAARGSSK